MFVSMLLDRLNLKVTGSSCVQKPVSLFLTGRCELNLSLSLKNNAYPLSVSKD